MSKVSGTFSVRFDLLDEDALAAGELSPASRTVDGDDWKNAITVTSGAAEDQLDQLYAQKRNLGSSSNETLDLTDLTLLNGLNEGLNYAKINLIYVAIPKGQTWTGDLLIGGAANPFATWLSGTVPKIVMGPMSTLFDSVFFLYRPDLAGYVVTAATADELKIDNTDSSNDVDFNLIIGGRLT